MTMQLNAREIRVIADALIAASNRGHERADKHHTNSKPEWAEMERDRANELGVIGRRFAIANA